MASLHGSDSGSGSLTQGAPGVAVPIVRPNWAKIYFGCALLAVAFACGFAVGNYKIFPHQLWRMAESTLLEGTKNWKAYLHIEPVQHLAPAKHDGVGVVTYVREKAFPGVTLLTSFLGKNNGLRLIDMDGKILHEWNMSYEDIWRDQERPVDRIHDDWKTEIHGALLYPNGDVVFNYEGAGLVKVSRCAQPIWRLSHRTHHSIFRDSDGNLWVPGFRRYEEAQERWPLLWAPIRDDLIFKISPEGQILREISLLDVIYNSNEEAILFADRSWGVGHNRDRRAPIRADITHLNDIEVLDPAAAAAFPLFAPGDLLVSMRNINTIAVIDPKAERIKWRMTGPFLRQHDPDFLPNGWISVYDNHSEGKVAKALGGSRILQIDPGRHQTTVTYEGSGQDERSFYTEIRGKHQYLPNGNILITEFGTGRAFEVARDGEIVWSFLNARWDEDSVFELMEASRYPEDYAEFTKEASSCP
jgi:Arylsulfotransferase (ASST)